jgi:hypothetical protein
VFSTSASVSLSFVMCFPSCCTRYSVSRGFVIVLDCFRVSIVFASICLCISEFLRASKRMVEFPRGLVSLQSLGVVLCLCCALFRECIVL